MSAKSDAPILEWVMGALGGAVFLGLLIVLTISGLSERGAPEITAEVAEIQATSSGHVVKFIARNKGGLTGAGVRLVATLTIGGAIAEEREAQLDYLPVGSIRRGGFIFQKDPNLGVLKIEPDGYVDP